MKIIECTAIFAEDLSPHAIYSPVLFYVPEPGSSDHRADFFAVFVEFGHLGYGNRCLLASL